MSDPATRPAVIDLPDEPSVVEARLGPTIVATDDLRPIEAREQATAPEAPISPSRRRSRRPFRVAVIGVGILIVGLLVFDAVEWIRSQFDRGPIVGSVAAGVIAAGILGVAYWLITELRALAALKSVERLQAMLTAADGQRQPERLRLIDHVIGGLPAEATVVSSLTRYRERVQPYHSFDQRIELLSDTILAPIDRQAEALIRGAIAQTVIFTAINPVAFMESLFFVGRGLRLMRQIAELYGGRPGFIGSVHLMRRLVVGSGAVGAADIVGNVLTQKLGGILNKVTLGVAEDVAESVYAAQKVATLGIASMRLCRPIPFTPGAAPSVSGLVAHAIQR